MDDMADVVTAQAMFARCGADSHVEGELDERVVGFYERLCAMFPDDGSLGSDSPWIGSGGMARAFSWCETDESEGVGVMGGHVPGGLGDVVPAGESQ